MPRESKACGMEVDSTKPASIKANSMSRTGIVCGSSQLVAQHV